ncbi:MAG TPA: hypothetical protein VFB62_02675, partial [Polyangiaceae bacterium]|nr:hypothetical protein [Polyangiaceae bacterium]
MIRVARGMVLLAILACGRPPVPTSPKAAEEACLGGDADACERAIVAVDSKRVERLVDAYVAAGGERSWRTLLDRLKQKPERPAYVGTKRAPKGADAIRIALHTEVVPVPEVAFAIAKAAHRRHVLIDCAPALGCKSVEQLFGDDVLEPHTLGLPAILSADEKHLEREIALAAGVQAAIEAARRFDYIGAARHVEKLRQSLATPSEGALRARHAIALLAGAGVALEREEDAPIAYEPPARVSTPYAHYLAVLLASDRHRAWQARRARIAPLLSPARLALVDGLFRAPGACATPQIPPMEKLGDLVFSGWLATTLDPQVSPGERAARGRLGLTDWLPRYEKFVRLVRASRSTWAFAPQLLQARGEVGGLSAAGTSTYAEVTELALAHLKALDALSKTEPARFSQLSVLTLAYQPGVLEDARLIGAVRDLASSSIRRKIESAPAVGPLFESGLTAFALGTSLPPPFRGPQLEALGEGLANKLGGRFGDQRGWRIAALHVGDLLLAKALGKPAPLARAAPRIGQALSGNDVPYPAFARLAAAAANYAAVADAGKLDASVSNPAMFPPERTRARDALRDAIARLEDGGPQSADDRDFHKRLTELADGLVALVAGELASEARPTCGENKKTATQDRLIKTRRSVVDALSKVQSRGDGAWIRRARFVALVLSDGLDIALGRGKPEKLTIASSDADRIVQAALPGWTEADVTDVVSGGYLLARGAYASDGDKLRLMRHAARALGGLSRLFTEKGKESSSLFSTVARMSKEAMSVATSDIGEALAEHAKSSYDRRDFDSGDLALLLVLGSSLVRQEPVSDRAIAIARERHRPVYPALLLYGRAARDGGDPTELTRALHDAARQSCGIAEAEGVIEVRKAIYDFRHGRRNEALKVLGAALSRAERRGLAVPRQVFQYQQQASGRAFSIEQSFSFGAHLLKGSGSLQVGLGMHRGVESGGRLDVRFTDPKLAPATEDAARYYAQVAAITSVYRFVAGDRQGAVDAAQRAIGGWANGVRLGWARVPVAGQTVRWVQDGAGVLAIAAQLAADAGETFVAGDLWTLARAALGEEASDDDVKAVLDPLPEPLRDIGELTPAIERANRSLETLADKLACTKRPGHAADLERVGCDAYPLALSLRVADGLTRLPRIKPGPSAPICEAWRALDGFLAPLEQQRYEPDRFLEAIEALRKHDRHNDAATLLARQRHPSHCAPAVVA